jgi:hypothetical protein
MSLRPQLQQEIRIQRFRRASQGCGVAAAVAGGVVALLWVLQPAALSGFGALWLMKANTAMALFACGASLALVGGRRAGSTQLARGLALVAGVVGGLTLLEYVTGANFGIDISAASDLTAGLRYPGRMAPQTAIALVVFAAGRLTADRRDGFASYVCDAAIITILMVLQAVMSGYFFHGLSFAGLEGAPLMSPQTVGAFTVLWFGLVCRRAGIGLMEILSGDGRGSAAIRYLMPPTILAPVAIASVRLWGESSGWRVTPFSASLFGTIQSLIRIATVLGMGYLLNRAETQRQAEQARREEAERMVAMCAWTRRVRWDGEWISVDDFLKARFGLEITHGISDEALAEELAALGSAEDSAVPSSPS